MTDSRTCPRCGAALAPGEDPAQCPRCLLRVGMDVSSASVPGTRVPAPSIAELQPFFPELELLALVGEGGMGAVYKARDRKLERVVALKVLTVRDEENAHFDERFAREARAMASLSHPNIAQVHGFGKSGPWSWLAMEYVDGENLRRVLRSRTVSPKDALAWVAQMCDALQYAHEHGVVHRDIKPENVLVDSAGRVKVVDFGLAKLLFRKPGEATLTGPQQSLGTWHYMAPEQYERPQDVDHRADIYSLGVVFYELLTGHVPVGRFEAPSQTIQLDVRIDEVVLKALAREPSKRYQAASEVRNEVRGIASSPGAPPARRASDANSKWIGIGVAALVLLILGALTFVAFFVLVRWNSASDPGAADVSSRALFANSARALIKFLPWAAVLAGFVALGALAWLRGRRVRREQAVGAAPTASESGPSQDSAGVVVGMRGPDGSRAVRRFDFVRGAPWVASVAIALVGLLLLGCVGSVLLYTLGARSAPDDGPQSVEVAPAPPAPPTRPAPEAPPEPSPAPGTVEFGAPPKAGPESTTTPPGDRRKP